jgi:hypothetical protein
MKAPEKMLCNEGEAVRDHFLWSALRSEYRENAAFLAYFTDNVAKFLWQLRLHGGGRSQERTLLRPNSLLTGKNTGNFAVYAVVFYVPSAVNALFPGTSDQE